MAKLRRGRGRTRADGKIDVRSVRRTRTTGQENVNVWTPGCSTTTVCSVSSVRSGQWAIQHEQRAQWVYFYATPFCFLSLFLSLACALSLPFSLFLVFPVCSVHYVRSYVTGSPAICFHVDIAKSAKVSGSFSRVSIGGAALIALPPSRVRRTCGWPYFDGAITKPGCVDKTEGCVNECRTLDSFMRKIETSEWEKTTRIVIICDFCYNMFLPSVLFKVTNKHKISRFVSRNCIIHMSGIPLKLRLEKIVRINFVRFYISLEIYELISDISNYNTINNIIHRIFECHFPTTSYAIYDTFISIFIVFCFSQTRMAPFIRSEVRRTWYR